MERTTRLIYEKTKKKIEKMGNISLGYRHTLQGYEFFLSIPGREDRTVRLACAEEIAEDISMNDMLLNYGGKNDAKGL